MSTKNRSQIEATNALLCQHVGILASDIHGNQVRIKSALVRTGELSRHYHKLIGGTKALAVKKVHQYDNTARLLRNMQRANQEFLDHCRERGECDGKAG